MTSSPVFLNLQAPLNKGTTFTAGQQNQAKIILTAGVNGLKVSGIGITNNNATTSFLCEVKFNDGVTGYIISTHTIPANAGRDGIVPAYNILKQADMPFLNLDKDGNPFMLLKNAESIRMQILTVIPAGTTITVTGFGVEF